MKIKTLIFLIIYFLLMLDSFFPIIIKLMATVFVIYVIKEHNAKENAKTP